MGELKYLFICRFRDGTILHQSQKDVSSIDPTKSKFFDVLQRLEDVETFQLHSDSHTYLVDLRDGHFEVDGAPFSVHEEFAGSIQYRLIYFRRNQVYFNSGMEKVGHHVEYHIGWQTTVDGRNYKQTIRME